MKQDFEYQEEDFSQSNSKDENNAPFSVDEMLEDEKEDGISLLNLLREKKKLLFIIASTIILVILMIIFFLVILPNIKSSVPSDSMANEEQSNADEIKFDEDGFIIEKEEVVENIFKYNLDEIKYLREAGYTNTEIEEFERMEVTNLEPLVTEVKEQAKSNLLEIYQCFLRDTKSTGNEEYLYALANTWLGLPPQIINKEGVVDDYYKDSCNADYWKLPLQGYQPMLKLRFIDHMDIERTVYMSVDPSVYVSLRDSGNILITYNFVKAYGCDFITNIQKAD